MSLTQPIKKNDKIEDKSQIIANNLSILLKQHNSNANQLANGLGIPFMTVKRILSGETIDPRISTLKLIAEYFNVTIDFLITPGKEHNLRSVKTNKSYVVPKIQWDDLRDILTLKNIDFKRWNEWQTVSLHESETISKYSFALESRPSMYPRFSKGTIFIIDPEILPSDGDLVLVNLLINNEFTLKELIIDPPEWRLSPLVANSKIIDFSEENHRICGVIMLTMLYNPKLNG